MSFRIFLDYLGASNVAWHQIGCELDAFEGQVQRLGQRADEERLREPRNALKQCVASGEHGDQHLLDHVVLSDDHLRKLVAKAVVGLLAPLHRSDVIFVGRFGHEFELRIKHEIVRGRFGIGWTSML